jgi:hypothetical protein
MNEDAIRNGNSAQHLHRMRVVDDKVSYSTAQATTLDFASSKFIAQLIGAVWARPSDFVSFALPSGRPVVAPRTAHFTPLNSLYTLVISPRVGRLQCCSCDSITAINLSSLLP